MVPPSNSVNFSGDRIRLEFSERVDRSSLERALTIVPELSSPPEFNWKGRALELRFIDSLAEATTYVITIDNGFRDERRVSISQPIVRAIATGPVIDEGTIRGRLLDARSSAPVPNLDVIATRIDTADAEGASFTSYRTQSGSDGEFTLKYLPDVPFFAFALEDRNRNRILDAGEQFAVAPQRVFHPVLEDSLGQRTDWWVVNPDTARPRITGVRARSSRRIEIRYDEPIHLDTLDPGAWVIRDTLSGPSIPARQIYRSPSDSRRLVLVTDSLPEAGYRVEQFAFVRDSAGNAAAREAPAFYVPAAADTVRLRFLEFVPAPTVGGGAVALTQREQPGVRFNQYVPAADLPSLLSVRDTSGTERSFSSVTDDGVTWRLLMRPPLEPGQTVRITLSSALVSADTTRERAFRRLSTEETGSFVGYVESAQPVVVQVFSEQGRALRLQATTRTGGEYRFDGLTAGNYRLRLFADEDGDGLWDWGSIDPYERPEALVWYADSSRVRPGWETVLDTLRIDPPSN